MVRQSQPQYGKDESVLCYHGDIMYPAKILDMRLSDPDDKKSDYEYRVHYKQWKSTWDEWLSADRIREDNNANRHLAMTIHDEAKAAMKKPPKTSLRPKDKNDRGSSMSARGTKRGRDTELEQEDQFESRPAVRIVLPDTLRSLLVDDWENITKNLQVVELPAKAPVNKLLEWYVEEEKPKRQNEADEDVLEEIISGLKEYFEKAIGRILLYYQERDQYRYYRERLEKGLDGFDNKTMGDVYGAEHMARLLALMPELLAQTSMSQQATSRVREEISKFAIWLNRNSQEFFSSKYHSPPNTFVYAVPKPSGDATATGGLGSTREGSRRRRHDLNA